MSYIQHKNIYGYNDITAYKAINHLIFLENKKLESEKVHARDAKRNGINRTGSKKTNESTNIRVY